MGLMLKIPKPQPCFAVLDFISFGPLKKASFLRGGEIWVLRWEK
jgi:hypothetical protein